MPDRGRVAIVDDDEAARDALEFLLRVLGRRPQGFASAAAFLSHELGRFKCLILDQHMPHMTGVALAQHLKTADLRIPILLISGDLTRDIAERAALAGIEVVADKPIDLQTLSAFVGKWAS